mmetsp:Transcript_4953/g.9932  ORF Transcript_4953/g.9932 Transcript_4953/m.9932 type:complete len:207 (-) Transcript_4953:41-661(-)
MDQEERRRHVGRRPETPGRRGPGEPGLRDRRRGGGGGGGGADRPGEVRPARQNRGEEAGARPDVRGGRYPPGAVEGPGGQRGQPDADHVCGQEARDQVGGRGTDGEVISGARPCPPAERGGQGGCGDGAGGRCRPRHDEPQGTRGFAAVPPAEVTDHAIRGHLWARRSSEGKPRGQWRRCHVRAGCFGYGGGRGRGRCRGGGRGGV